MWALTNVCTIITNLMYTYPIRLNKYNKSLINNPHECEINLATSTSRDVASHFANLKSGNYAESLSHSHPRVPHQCVLWGAFCDAYMPTDKELADLRLQGADVDIFSLSTYRIAYILNYHFKSGQYNTKPVCSVIHVDNRCSNVCR